MALLDRGKKKMVALDGCSNYSEQNTANMTRALSREEKQEAAMRNMTEEEYLEFKEFKAHKEL